MLPTHTPRIGRIMPPRCFRPDGEIVPEFIPDITEEMFTMTYPDLRRDFTPVFHPKAREHIYPLLTRKYGNVCLRDIADITDSRSPKLFPSAWKG